MFAKFKGKNVLLLQGPLGPFFRRFADELEEGGAVVTKVNFCGGDRFFYHRGDRLSYTGSLQDWPGYAEQLIQERQIDAIFVLGDMRPYHRPVREIAERHGVDFYAFEEGYIRPNHITLELGGVNGNSALPREPEFYRNAGKAPLDDVVTVGGAKWISFLIATAYYVSMAAWWWRYPRYQHHRQAFFLFHALCYVRSFWRKNFYRIKEAGIGERLVEQHPKGYYLFPLQVHNDYQFMHSDYERIEDCIEEVVASFATDANEDLLLVIKHHPADRPYRDYTAFVRRLANQHGLQGRLIYIHDQHLPTLLKNARGTILMNSTVGISSLHHQAPVKVMGRAVYDIPQLTYQGSLREFWQDPGEVDMEFYMQFRGWLEYANQANGNFYRRLPGHKKGAGVRWFPALSLAHAGDIQSGKSTGGPAPVTDGALDTPTEAEQEVMR